ncbi:MAG: glycosyltransferase family 39 protein, partial [Desulfarculaceae bacterium]
MKHIISNYYSKLPKLAGSRLAFLIVITGICLRLIQYLFNRSLWWDESLLALNIINTPLEKLFEPLAHNQAAPPGFLFLERFWVWALNAHEYALRLVPLLAGLASLYLFLKLARNWLSQKAYVLALLFFAFSYHLIYYSAEVKQYSLDVFIALLLYYLFGKWISGQHPKRALFLLSLAGGLTVWFSHPGIFILSGLGLYALIHHLRQHDYRRLFAFIIPGAIWLLSFGLVYFLVLDRASASTALNIYWDEAFLPFPPSSLADLKQA